MMLRETRVCSGKEVGGDGRWAARSVSSGGLVFLEAGEAMRARVLLPCRSTLPRGTRIVGGCCHAPWHAPPVVVVAERWVKQTQRLSATRRKAKPRVPPRRAR